MYNEYGYRRLARYFSSPFEQDAGLPYKQVGESAESDVGWATSDIRFKEELNWNSSARNSSKIGVGSLIDRLGGDSIEANPDHRLNNTLKDAPIAVIPCGLLYPRVFIGNIPPNISFEALKNLILTAIDDCNNSSGSLISLNYQSSYKEWRTAYASLTTWNNAQKVIQHLHLRRHFKNVPYHRLVACVVPYPPPSVLSSSFESAYDPSEAESIILEFQEINKKLLLHEPRGTEIWLPSYNRIERSRNFCNIWNCFKRDEINKISTKWMQYYKENGTCDYWDSLSGHMQSHMPSSSSMEDKLHLPTTITLLRDGPGGANLFIYGIPNDWTEVTLMQLCQKFGHIVGIRLPAANDNDKLNRCFGFISYDNKPSTWAAIRSISGIKFLGKPLKLQLKAGEDSLLPLTLRPIVEGSARNKNGGIYEYSGFGESRNRNQQYKKFSSPHNQSSQVCKNSCSNSRSFSKSKERGDQTQLSIGSNLYPTHPQTSKYISCNTLSTPSTTTSSHIFGSSSALIFSDFFDIQSTPSTPRENSQHNVGYYADDSNNLNILLKNILSLDNMGNCKL
ncbi:RNA recognition motif family protein [Cryptosporidium serpentis]